MTIDEIKANLGNRWWRLNNLYYVKDKHGNKVLFRPNFVQKYLHDNLWFFNIVPKARQLGITTFFCILYLDQVLFSENKTAGIIAHRQEDMKKIFKNKVKFAWDNLHPWLKAKVGSPNTDSAYELSFPNGSNIFVSMTTRSGTVQFLHISEFAYVCKHFPEKAEEIVTGAINSVEAGNCVSIESTAAGREGYFYKFCMTAMQMKQEGKELTPLDFKIFFFPWHIEPHYTMDANFAIPKEYADYFDSLQSKHHIILSDGQKRWYIKKAAVNREKMFSEYPSTMDEAFSEAQEGAYYAKEMNKVYLEKRIRFLPHDRMLPVDTWWDLGMNDFNVVIFVQTKGEQIRFIDLYWNNGEGLQHYYDMLQRKRDDLGYRYRWHVMPHDINVRDLSSGQTRQATLFQMGMRGIRVAPKVGIQDGIDRVRTIFSKFYFDEVKTTKLHESLFNYRRDFDQKVGVWKDSPRHDDNSHFADAVRTGAQLWREEIFYGDEDDAVLAKTEQAFFSG